MIRMGRSALSLAFLSVLAGPLSAQSVVGGAVPPSASFGGSIAVAGSDVLVGEPGNRIRPGIVYVFQKEAGEWVEVSQIMAPDAVDADGFGASLAADGNTLLVSSSNGGVYVFERGTEGWSEAGLVTPVVASTGVFGVSLALSGDLAVVGAPMMPRGGPPAGPGTVYVFRRVDGEWEEATQLHGAEGSDGDLFGVSVALDGTRVLVGAPGADSRAGAVHAFEIDLGTGVASETGVLQAPGGGPNDAFGGAISLEGDRALIGAPLAAGTIGTVHIFHADAGGDGWTPQGQLLPFDGGPRYQFGTSIAQDADRILVGAPFASTAYVFRASPDGDGFISAEKIAPAGAGGGQFGASMAMGDGIAAFGLPRADNGIGQASIFEENEDGWSEANRVISEAEAFDAVRGGQIDCSEGVASVFGCAEVDLVSFMPNSELGADRGIGTNDVWGWTDPETGREYALVGMRNQTSFVDISDAANPVLVGTLPMTEGANPSVWRDIKTYQNHAYIVSDGAGQHGVQVLDLTRFRDFDGEPITFTADVVYDRIASAHNIVINEDAGFAYAVGSRGGGETCGGGLHIIDIREPKNPTFAGCFSDPQTGRSSTGYTHDGQCVNYEGPDEEYRGRFICFGANETALSIADVTDPSDPVALSRATYPNVGYSHQGWLTEDHRYFYMNDELDEIQQAQAGTPMAGTRTLIWDVSDLDDPQLVKEHFGTTTASDHNLYIVGDRMYQSNYQSGFRVLDISDPENPVEVAHLDTVPYGTDTPGMGGSWSNYPFFASGMIVVTSGSEGLFIVRSRGGRPIS